MKLKTSTKIIFKFQIFTIFIFLISLIFINMAYFWISLEDYKMFYDDDHESNYNANNVAYNISESPMQDMALKQASDLPEIEATANNAKSSFRIMSDNWTWKIEDSLDIPSVYSDEILPLDGKWKYWNHIEDNCFYIKKEWKLCLSDSHIFFQNIYKFDDQYFYVQKMSSWSIAIRFSETMNFHINLLKISIGIFIFYVFISYFFWYIFLKSIYSKVFKAVNELKENNYINLKTYKLSEKDELKILFETINEQIDSISSFNKYLSHELKTPLMNISSSIDLLNIKYKDPKLLKMKEHIFYMKDIIDTLNKLILLENKKIPIHFDDINICALVKDYAEKIDLKVNIDSYAENIKTSKELFSIILKNLLDNAKKYSKSTPSIELTNKYIKFSNKTDKKLDLEKLTQKFFKQSNNWMGIWLYLVEKIANLLNYRLKIYQEKDIFIIEIFF